MVQAHLVDQHPPGVGPEHPGHRPLQADGHVAQTDSAVTGIAQRPGDDADRVRETIITTVLQTLINRLDLGYSLPAAIAAPRASQRNQASGKGEAEPAFLASSVGQTLQSQYGQQFTMNPEIGAATGVEFLGHGLVLAAAEPVRRGGGSALVVREVPRQR
jgi:hypothetical protein